MTDHLGLFERWRQRRLERARLRLADAEWYFERWVRPFAPSPSERLRAARRVEKCRAKVVALGGDDA